MERDLNTVEGVANDYWLYDRADVVALVGAENVDIVDRISCELTGNRGDDGDIYGVYEWRSDLEIEIDGEDYRLSAYYYTDDPEGSFTVNHYRIFSA